MLFSGRSKKGKTFHQAGGRGIAGSEQHEEGDWVRASAACG
jgi:hypothetical protein